MSGVRAGTHLSFILLAIAHTSIISHGTGSRDETVAWLEYTKTKFSGGLVAKRTKSREGTLFCFVPAVDWNHRDYVSLFAPILAEQGITPCELTSTAPAEVRFVILGNPAIRAYGRRPHQHAKRLPTPMEWLGPSVLVAMADRRVAVLQVNSLSPLAVRGGLAAILLAALGPKSAWDVMPRTAVVRAGDSEGVLERAMRSFGFEALQHGQHLVLKGPKRRAAVAAKRDDGSGTRLASSAAKRGGLVAWAVPRSGEGWGYGTTSMLSEQLRSSFCGGGSPSATLGSRGVGLDCAPPPRRYGGRSYSDDSGGGGTGGGDTAQRRVGGGSGPEVVLQRCVGDPFLVGGRRLTVRALLLVLPSSSPAKGSQERSKLFHDFGQWALAPREEEAAGHLRRAVNGSTVAAEHLTPLKAGHQRTSLTKLGEYLAANSNSLTAVGWNRWMLDRRNRTENHRPNEPRHLKRSRSASGVGQRDGSDDATANNLFAKEAKEAVVREWGRTMSSLLGVLHKTVRGAPHGQVSLLGADLVLDRDGKFWLVDMSLFPPMSVAGSSERRAMFRPKVKDVVLLSALWAAGEALPPHMCPEHAMLASDKKGGGPGSGKCLCEFSEASWPVGVDAAQAMLTPLTDEGGAAAVDSTAEKDGRWSASWGGEMQWS